MKTNAVTYEETTPLSVIWEFLGRVTLGRVVIVRQGVPTGMISRATLLRWLGSLGAMLDGQGQDRPHSNLRKLCRHIHATAEAILQEAERLTEGMGRDSGESSPAACRAAIRLQEQAQALLGLSQLHACFEPGPLAAPEASDSALSTTFMFGTGTLGQGAVAFH
jgi:hypothetical protein